mgnify:CR=1 FL=1
MKRFALALILAVAACAMPGAVARPEAARIDGTVLSVRFKDGETCQATLSATGGEGVFDGCGGASYAVTVTAQNPLEPLLGAAVDPYADVVVTTRDGAVTRLRLPVSREPGFDQGTLG